MEKKKFHSNSNLLLDGMVTKASASEASYLDAVSTQYSSRMQVSESHNLWEQLP